MPARLLQLRAVHHMEQHTRTFSLPSTVAQLNAPSKRWRLHGRAPSASHPPSSLRSAIVI